MGIMETDFFLTSRMDVSLSKFYQIFLPSLQLLGFVLFIRFILTSLPFLMIKESFQVIWKVEKCPSSNPCLLEWHEITLKRMNPLLQPLQLIRSQQECGISPFPSEQHEKPLSTGTISKLLTTFKKHLSANPMTRHAVCPTPELCDIRAHLLPGKSSLRPSPTGR